MYIDFWHTIGYFIIGTEAFHRPQTPLIFFQTRQKNGRHHSHKRPPLIKSSSISKLEIVAGLCATLGWVICCAISAISVQLIEKRIPDFELNATRSSLSWIGSVLILLLKRRIPSIPREIIPWVIATIVVQNAQSSVHYIGITFIPLASFQCVVVTLTLASGILIHRCMNNDRLHATKLIATCVCTAGIGFVTQPQFLHHVLGISDPKAQRDDVFHISSIIGHNQSSNLSFSQNSNLTPDIVPEKSQYIFNQTSNTTEYHKSTVTRIYTTSDEMFGYAFAIVSGVLVPLYVALNRNLTSRKEFHKHILSYLFWTLTFGLLMSSILMLIFETFTLPQTVDDLLYMLGHSLSYAGVILCMLYATKTVSGHTICIMSSLQTILMLAAQYSILEEILPGHHNWQELTGVFLCLAGSMLPPVYDIIKKQT